ncbi:ATP-dependent RecD-like DNA helicase [Burkholderia sp. AD24]|nr:ATP-dependent RecD-like DNA helicase [Burkholderia sp. AD24]
MVQSIYEVSPTSHCVRLLTEFGVEHAWLTEGRLSTQISVGQVWELSGGTIDLGESGEQFEIVSGVPGLPEGELLLEFLRHHVPGLGMVNLRRWKLIFGDDLPHVLARGEFSELSQCCRGPGSATLTRLAISIWNKHAAYTQIARELYAYGLDEPILRAFSEQYGCHGLEMLKNDPYRLLAYTDFERVDLLANRHYGIGSTDSRRLMGAVDASVYEWNDQGFPVASRTQLLATIERIAKLTSLQASQALELAEDRQRIIRVKNTWFLSEGNARTMALVTDRLFRHTPPIGPDSSETEGVHFDSVVTSVENLIEGVLAAQTSVVVTNSYASSLDVLRSLTSKLRASQHPYEIVGGTAPLVRRIRVDGIPETISVDEPEAMRPPVPSNAYRTLMFASSTIDFISTARFLQHVHASDRLVFIGEPLSFSYTRRLPLFPVLLSIDSVSRFVCSDDAGPSNCSADQTPGLKELLNGQLDKIRYDSRHSERQGIFSVSIKKSDFCRAALGLCYQLSKLGTVSVVLHPAQAKHDYLRAFGAQRGHQAPYESGYVTVDYADAIEPGVSDSSVVMLAGSLSDSVRWVKTAVRTARTRAIVVGLLPNDALCSTAEQESGLTPNDLLTAISSVSRK